MLPFLEDIAREFPEPLQPIRQLLTALGVLNEQLDVIGIKVQKTQQLLNLLLLLLILPPLSCWSSSASARIVLSRRRTVSRSWVISACSLVRSRSNARSFADFLYPTLCSPLKSEFCLNCMPSRAILFLNCFLEIRILLSQATKGVYFRRNFA